MRPDGGCVGVTSCETALVAPRSSVAVSVTVNLPAVAYVWAGFGAIDVAPSPKVQLEALIEPSGSLLVFVKVQVRALQLDVNAAVGGWFAVATVTVSEVAVAAPWSSVAVSVTVNVPAVAYEWDGFGAIDDAPSPKVQWYPAIEPSGSLLAFVKSHVNGLQVGVNPTTGGWFDEPLPAGFSVMMVASHECCELNDQPQAGS